MKYRTKPVEVEARQVTSEDMEDIAKWCNGRALTFGGTLELHVWTEGEDPYQVASVGDWLVKYRSGSFDVYTNESFLANFDRVES